MRRFIVLLLVGGIVTISQANEMKFLESYAGLSVDQLIAMESDYRVDSLVLALEHVIKQKKVKRLSQVEVDVLAVEAMEREVSNGGFHQFFLNSSQEYVAELPLSLGRIGCPIAAKIVSDALAYLKIDGDVTVAKIDTKLHRLGDKAIVDLGKMDDRYFQNKEPIADKLFAYVKSKRGEINLK